MTIRLSNQGTLCWAVLKMRLTKPASDGVDDDDCYLRTVYNVCVISRGAALQLFASQSGPVQFQGATRFRSRIMALGNYRALQSRAYGVSSILELMFGLVSCDLIIWFHDGLMSQRKYADNDRLLSETINTRQSQPFRRFTDARPTPEALLLRKASEACGIPADLKTPKHCYKRARRRTSCIPTP